MNVVMDAMIAVPVAPYRATAGLFSSKESLNQPDTQAFRPD
jgi:hypothetical protein